MQCLNCYLLDQMQATTSKQMGDVVLTSEAGLLHSSTWCLRMLKLTECVLQLSRFHAGGDIGVEDAARILNSRFPSALPSLPFCTVANILKDLPPPPTTRKQMATLRRRLSRLASYPHSSKGLLVVECVTEQESLVLTPQAISLARGYTRLLAIAVPPPPCYLSFVMRSPYPHIYEEHYIS